MADEAASDLARLREAVSELRSSVHQAGTHLDAAEIRRRLEELLPRARARSDARLELAQLLILMGRVEGERGELKKARDLLIEGLAIDAGGATDPAERARDLYFLASVESGLKSFASAAEHYHKAADIAATTADFDLAQRLGMRERQAYALHEAQRFVEAYAVNRAVLEEGERAGLGDERLCTVLINAAQNLYAMRRLVEAQSHLRRALASARARTQIELEQDLLYQLAVLASEQGKAAEARALLVERVERLETLGPSPLKEAARRSLEHFDRHQRRA